MIVLRKLTGASSPLMAPPPLHSSFSLLRPQPHPFSLPNPNPNLITRYPLLPLRSVKLKTSLPHSSTDSDTNQASSAAPPPPPEKKSFAVATGELFLGLATRIIKRRNEGSTAASVAMFESSGKFSDERIAKVIEDEIDPGVVWEQRVKDVEAEKERRVITSPGFSFSAAGLLFPYHLGNHSIGWFLSRCHCLCCDCLRSKHGGGLA